jgi:transcriptional regulator with GAF, ATPase, and Fis domain
MYHPLGFQLLLEDYFLGTKPQKRNAFLKLVRAIMLDREASALLMDLLRDVIEKEASEILLRIAERLDTESHRITWREEDFQSIMLNTIRFYSCAGDLIKELRKKREGKRCGPVGKKNHPSSLSNHFALSHERIREELINVFRENRCVRKAAAESLLTTPEHLSSKIFPRFRIDEKEVKKEWIYDAVEQNHGRVKEAARQLGINIRTLQKKLKIYSTEKPLAYPSVGTTRNNLRSA